MLHRFQRLFWQQRKLMILSIGLLVGIFFVVQIYLNYQIINVTIAADPARGESYQLAQAISHQLVICSDRVRLKVIETKGSDQNLELLKSGKVDLASIPVNSSVSSSVKLVSYLFNDLFHIVVSEKSGIKQIADLQGKRISIPQIEDRADDFFWILLKHYRLSRQDVMAQSMPGEASDDAFLNNSVDCKDLNSLDDIKAILYQRFAIAIDAFDRDRITFESLQSIRFTWDATMLAIKDRESYLLR